MNVTVNGNPLQLADGLSLSACLASLGVPPRGVAVERNLEIVPRSAFPTTILEEGDRIEIVQFVGGG